MSDVVFLFSFRLVACVLLLFFTSFQTFLRSTTCLFVYLLIHSCIPSQLRSVILSIFISIGAFSHSFTVVVFAFYRFFCRCHLFILCLFNHLFLRIFAASFIHMFEVNPFCISNFNFVSFSYLFTLYAFIHTSIPLFIHFHLRFLFRDVFLFFINIF